jgi:Uma2 family endonuclease
MSTLSTYRFDVSDFEKLYVAGILSEDDRIELLDGDLIRMAPIGGNHRTVVDLLGERLTDLRRGRYRVGIQNPIRLGEFSELLPDIALFPVEIMGRHPGPEEVYLVIEVADASLMYDQGPKLEIYARSSVREVWIGDLINREIQGFREPDAVAGRYGKAMRMNSDEVIHPAEFSDIKIRLSEFFI